MKTVQKFLPILFLSIFVAVSVVGGWQVLQRFDSVRTGLPVEALKWHRGVSSLIQSVGNLTEKLGVAQSVPSPANLNQLTIALDTAIIVEEELNTRTNVQDHLGTRAVRQELTVLLTEIENLLERGTAFDRAEALRQHVRLIYLSNELETAYLTANEATVSQLLVQADVLGALKTDTLILLGLIGAAIGIIFVFLTRARRANALLSVSQDALEDRKRVLDSANEHLERAQRMAHFGSWSWDVASGAVVWSNEAYRIFGHEPGSFPASYDAFMQAVHPEDRERVVAAITTAMETKQPYDIEHRVVHPGGALRYVQEQGVCIYADDDKPVRMDGTVQDITDVRASQIAMRDSDTRFRAMVENAGDGIYIHDRYGKILDVNQVACDQVGYTRDELLALTVAQLDTAIDFDQLRDTWDMGDVDPRQFPMTLETAHRRKDGSIFPIEVRVSILPSEEGTRFVAMVRDVTERKQAERELEFQKSALDEHAIVSIADVAGDIVYINDKFCEISGYSREELLGQNHSIVKSDEHPRAFYDDLWQTISSGRPWQGEIKNLKKGGGFYWVDATIVPFLNDKGKPFQYVAIRTDITERVLAKEEAETANKAKSEFLSSMSHELRTPLNAICGFSQLLETDRKNPLTEKQLMMVHQISKGGKHLLDLINDILDLAKIEAGKLSISIEGVAPGAIVTDAMNLVKEMAARRNVSVAMVRSLDGNDCDDPYEIMVDQNRFRQVLLNLLSNAVKYNRDGGEVSLMCARDDQGRMRFTVSDTGMGIPAEMQEQLFTPFHRLGAENGEVEGTGIGLTITRTLTELMGGEIDFSSREGEGTDFWVAFPLAEDQSSITAKNLSLISSNEKAAQMNDAQLNHTVLYIEDNPANLNLMEMIFERLDGVRMISAHTAELGLELAEQERPDLILMDINLPGMSGVEALKQIQSSETLRSTPVIAVSANAMKHDIESALEAGFKGYITKPFEVNDIIDAVSAQLG